MELAAHVVARLPDLGVREGEKVGIAVSGGSDSVALLHLLAEAQHRLGIRLHVLHVDHGLRTGSEHDGRFVAELAHGLGIECMVQRISVERTRRGSLESDARDARYAALESAAARTGCHWVATAHTRDDQAETVLMRVVRGAGVGGLAGIARVRGMFVRPLLDRSRSELRTWLSGRGLTWREDPTNADLTHERNWVRHVLLPSIIERRPGAPHTLARLAEHARLDEEALDTVASDVLTRAEAGLGGLLVRANDLAPQPEAVARRVVRKAFRHIGHEAEAAEVVEALGLLALEPPATVGGHPRVWRVAEGLLFADTPAQREPFPLPYAGSTEVPGWGVRVRVSLLGRGALTVPPSQPLPQDKHRFRIGGSSDPDPWAWRCALPGPERLWLRPRRPGDRVQTAAGTRKVQDVLVDAKVPRPLRDLVPILATPDASVAVVGLTAPPVPSGRGPGRDEPARWVVVDVEPLDGGWWRRAGWWSPATS